MFRKVALSAAISFLVVTTTIAVFDYVRLLHRPVIEAEWQLHYALLVATPVDAAMLAYAQALLDHFLSPIPSLAAASGAALLVMLQSLASDTHDRQFGRALARWRSRAIASVALQSSKIALGKFATKTIR